MRLAPYTTFLSQTKPAGLGSFSDSAPPVMSRPILAQINLAALRKNLRVAREKSAGAQLLAVVKANAYGHGLLRAQAGLLLGALLPPDHVRGEAAADDDEVVFPAERPLDELFGHQDISGGVDPKSLPTVLLNTPDIDNTPTSLVEALAWAIDAHGEQRKGQRQCPKGRLGRPSQGGLRDRHAPSVGHDHLAVHRCHPAPEAPDDRASAVGCRSEFGPQPGVANAPFCP